MKTMIVLLFAFSFSAFASESGALDAVKKIFELQENEGGLFVGVTPENEKCFVSVAIHPDQAEIVASTENRVVSRIIVDGTGFRFNEGRREFLSSDRDGTFRTLAVTATRTYTVTSEMRDGRELALECILH